MSNMRTSWRSSEPKGIEDHLKDLCQIYRGETDNPHDVNALLDEERTIQILKYSLWDVERSILETPASWRYLYLEEKGSLPADDEASTVVSDKGETLSPKYAPEIIAPAIQPGSYP